MTYIIAKTAQSLSVLLKLEGGVSMILRISVLLFLAIAFNQNVAAKPFHVLPSNEVTTKAVKTQSVDVQKDLTGYWWNGSNQVLYFTQEGANLVSRYTRQTTGTIHYAKEIDFRATIIGDLIYGVHLRRLPSGEHEKCSANIWVGIGLTLNDYDTKLKGFRGDRTVDLANCDVETIEPSSFVYTRMLDADGNPMK